MKLLIALWQSYWQLFVLPCLVWISYIGILKGGPVSDDRAGIYEYDGKIQKPLSFHNIFKWIRWRIGKVPNPNPGKDKPQFVQSMLRHHRFSILLFCATSIFLYAFLMRIFSPQVAFLATCLFIVGPLGCQVVGWVSGVGYLLSFFFMLAGIDFCYLAKDMGWLSTPIGVILSMMGYGVLQGLSVQAIFASAGAIPILMFLGFWPFALVGALITFQGIAGTLKSAVDLRRKVFAEQQMAASTKFHIKKLVVMSKSLYYYTKLIFFPKRMGLYHCYFYHYEIPAIEEEDKYFWFGVLVLALMIVGFIFGSYPIKFSVIWFAAFILLFLNAITAHQFVSERYAWMPYLGACILMVSLFGNIPWLFWTTFGIALMRLWAHIPTYDDEVKFYQSNIWNFPGSEVAYGNLGVCFLSQGMIGSAIDSWIKGTQVNPEYDVNWYNLHTHLKMMGNHQKAREALEKAINCKTCHFPDIWKKELASYDAQLAQGRVPTQAQMTPKIIPVT